MKPVYVIILMALGLSGCTSTRSLSRKFSEKPDVIYRQFSGAGYANSPTRVDGHRGTGPLWASLSYYRQEKGELPAVSDDAVIHLTMENSGTLTVTALANAEPVASFDIPVRKRGKYLILENNVRTIPIPIVYFHIKENKAILAPLANGSIGYYSYNDETLWILFFGASNTGKAIHEYQPVK